MPKRKAKPTNLGKSIGESKETYLARTKWVKHNSSCALCREWLDQFDLTLNPKYDKTKNKKYVEKANKCAIGRRLYLLWQKSYPDGHRFKK